MCQSLLERRVSPIGAKCRLKVRRPVRDPVDPVGHRRNRARRDHHGARPRRRGGRHDRHRRDVTLPVAPVGPVVAKPGAEEAMFTRSEGEAVEAHKILDLCFRERAPFSIMPRAKCSRT